MVFVAHDETNTYILGLFIYTFLKISLISDTEQPSKGIFCLIDFIKLFI